MAAATSARDVAANSAPGVLLDVRTDSGWRPKINSRHLNEPAGDAGFAIRYIKSFLSQRFHGRSPPSGGFVPREKQDGPNYHK